MAIVSSGPPDFTPKPGVKRVSVPASSLSRDHLANLVGDAAANPSINANSLRVYVVLVTCFGDTEASAKSIADATPYLFTEAQVTRSLGQLRAAGLVTERRRTVGYNDGERRIRVRYYRIVVDA